MPYVHWPAAVRGTTSVLLTLIGTVCGLYFSSLLSTFWISHESPRGAVTLGGFAVLCGAATVAALWYPTHARFAAFAGTVAVAASLASSTTIDEWAAPLPLDFAVLFRHLSHTPLTYGLLGVVWVVSVAGVRRGHTRPDRHP